MDKKEFYNALDIYGYKIVEELAKILMLETSKVYRSFASKNVSLDKKRKHFERCDEVESTAKVIKGFLIENDMMNLLYAGFYEDIEFIVNFKKDVEEEDKRKAQEEIIDNEEENQLTMFNREDKINGQLYDIIYGESHKTINKERKNIERFRDEVFEKCNGKCYLCGENLSNGFHIDHVIPISRAKYFGISDANDIDNLKAACAKCNHQKTDKTKTEYEVWKILKHNDLI